jgi:epoxyqueuosine reductase
MERQWAQESGLGWIGKNSCLVSRKHGSFVFIAEIITSLQLAYDERINDYCGSCTKCIDACPTNAITSNRLINSNKCISYQTIENRGEISDTLSGKMERNIFGCDICQNVCPWNKKAVKHNEPLFQLRNEIKELSKEDWEQINEKKYQVIFKNSPVKRAKYAGLKRNINFVGNQL